MAITITQTDAPSRSKQAGPCWIAIDDVYAASTPRTIAAEPDDELVVHGKVKLRRATRTEELRKEWTIKVTGNPDDTVTLTIGYPQAVEATITGAVLV